MLVSTSVSDSDTDTNTQFFRGLGVTVLNTLKAGYKLFSFVVIGNGNVVVYNNDPSS